MKKKLTFLAFGLLLAVGWTNVAQAQKLAESPTKKLTERIMSPATNGMSNPVAKWDLKTEFLNDAQKTETNSVSGNSKLKAPNRAPNRENNTITADVALTRAQYEAFTYDWVDANGTLHPDVKVTEPATNPYQMAYLLGSTYMNPEIPGIQYTAVWNRAVDYANIEFGWDLPGNVRWHDATPVEITYNDITISIPSYWMDFNSIQIQSNGVTVEGGSWTYADNGTSLPSGWGGTATLTAENNGCCTQNGGGTIIIPHSIIDGKDNVTVVISARRYNDSHTGTDCTITIAGATPQSNEYTTTNYTEKTWSINPQSGNSSMSGTYYGDLRIDVPTFDISLRSITVKNANGTVLTSWDAVEAYNNNQMDYITEDGTNYYYYTLPGWSYDNYLFIYSSTGYVSDLVGYTQGTITIPASTLNNAGTSSITVEIVAYSETYGDDLYVNGELRDLTTSSATYTWSFNGTTEAAVSVTPPYQNGYTVFLVKVKDDATKEPRYTSTWSDVINYFDTHIDEVELLTDGTRLKEGTDDAGTMYTYSGEVNRFYFISKGKTYALYPYYRPFDSLFDGAPTYCMYEEFSAHQPYSDAADITDFYSKLLYGNSYNVVHDCQGVNLLEHYFSMSGKEGTEHKSMTNLIFWIPDHRSMSQVRTYDEEYLPHVGLYTITLEAEAQRAANYSTSNRKYDVTLDWVSSLNSILDFDVDQDYELWVYIYDDQGNPIADYKVLDRLQMQDLLVHNNTTFTYQVDQLATSQTIVYRVKGWPKDATNSPAEGGDFFALSNLDPVLIPGYENFLSLGVEHYESDFALDVEHNYYRNFLTIDNLNPDNALTPKRIENGEDEYELYRFDVAKPTQLTKAADLLFSVDNNKVAYLIEYANQNYVDEANVYNEYNNANLQGYTNPNNLGCPTYGEIATISEGGGTPPEPVDEYVKINSLNQLTSGAEYLIVCENNNVALNGGLTTLDVSGNTISVTPNNGVIQANATTNAATFTITASGNGYTIKSKSGYYIRHNSTRNNTLNTSLTTAYVNSISFTDNNATISYNYNNNVKYLQYQSGGNQGNRFRYYNQGTQQPIQLYKRVTDTGFNLLNNFLDNSTYTQVGQVVFELPWKSIQVKLQDESAGTSGGYFLIQNGGKLRFVMPAGYNNANVKFVIHNAPVSSNYYDGTFTLSSSTGATETITIPATSGYGDRDYEVIFNGISSGDVITITGTHPVVNSDNTITTYNYSPDFKYIHVYVQGGTGGISENTALNLDAIKFVDQFKASTSEDTHPYRYGYVLKAVGSNQESGKPEVPVLHTNSTVHGYYSLDDINNDIDREMVDPLNVMNAEVNMTLSRDPEIYYYTLDRKPSNVNNAEWEAVSKLQRREDDSYQEMFTFLPQYDDQICNPPTLNTTPWIVDRFDNYDVKTGGYNSFMSYVPVIWTHGDQKNRRVKWNIENRHNSYGAPIWKTGVAEVKLISATAERQDAPSTNWTYGDEECSLYMLDNIVAEAKMPTANNVKYVPYMFRIFVKSNNGKLRGYTYVPENLDDPVTPGEHYAGAPIDDDELQCVWSGYVNDPNNVPAEGEDYGPNGVSISYDGNTITFNKIKVYPAQGSDWDPENKDNAVFAGLKDIIQGEGNNLTISANDLKIVVRFYYIVEGFDASMPGRGKGEDPAGYGTEGSGDPSPMTAIRDVIYNATVESVTYVNTLGMTSDKPFDGVNIVITRYSNGMTTTSKVVR